MMRLMYFINMSVITVFLGIIMLKNVVFTQYYLDIIDALCDQADINFSCNKVDSKSLCNTQIHSIDIDLDVNKVF
jgi:hypothetical protein